MRQNSKIPDNPPN